mmetsp:Transcript_30896/g.35292  ORF Transcript_30896/g.35292 Transcript_30896/m.35292 type:complete len:186 (-) Transcript_30896:27-584(-)
MVRYSREPAVQAKSAKSRVADIRTSFKNTFEVAASIRGKMLKDAYHYLRAALAHKTIIPFRRYAGGVGRKAQANHLGENKGRWPEKSIRHVISLLKNVKQNVKAKGLDLEKCQISHIQVNKAALGRRRTYRAHGRITPYLNHPCHVELFVTEKAEDVKKGDGKKLVKLTKKQAARQRLAIGSVNQ